MKQVNEFLPTTFRMQKIMYLFSLLLGLNISVNVNAQAVIDIIEPVALIGGGTCQSGTDCTFSWTFDPTYLIEPHSTYGYLAGFKIMYVDGGTEYTLLNKYLITDFDEDGEVIIITNFSIPAGSYQLKIYDLYGDNASVVGNSPKSSGNFTVSQGDYINITSPTSGTFTHGDVITVEYQTNISVQGIYLRDENNVDTPITLDANNQFSVLSSYSEGDYTIFVDGNNIDKESAGFRIEPKRIQVTYPYNGLVFQRGVAKPVIRWTSNYEIEDLRIWVEDEDNTWVIAEYEVPELNSELGNSYTWSIPSNFHLDDDFEIYVRDNDSGKTDFQDGRFTITDPYSVETFTLNSAKSTTVKTPISNSSEIDGLAIPDKAQSISYVDGTGKVRQTNAIKSSPTQRDMVTPFEYDEIGKKNIDYLPYAELSTGGIYVSEVFEEQYDFYCFLSACESTADDVTGNSHPYSRVEVEKSPLQTVKEQGAPGADWQPGGGNTIRYESHANTAGDNIVHWKINGNGDPYGNDFYEESVISVSKTTDEDENVSYVYTNREGQEILKVGYLNGEGSQEVKTYYVYDHFGNLRFIIPPEAVDEIENTTNYETLTLSEAHSIRTTWLTEMQYDGYHRVVYKKIPEVEPVYTVYDKLGRVALTQDGNMRQSNEWFFTKYDIKGRAIMTGTYAEEDQTRQSRQDMQDYLNDWTGETWEDRTSNNFDTQHGYTFQTFPNSLMHSMIWSVTYYDDYDFNSDGSPDESFSGHSDFASLTGNNRSAHEADVVRTQGMVTGSKTRILTPRQVFENDSGEYGKGHSTSADEVYYIGTSNNNYSITLKPGFKTYPGQTVHIGSSDIVVSSSVMNSHTQGEWLDGVTFYDKYGRTIYTKSTNHMGGTDKTWTLYHFDGETEQTIYEHSSTESNHGTMGFVIKNRFEYDHAGRLIAQYQNTNNLGEVKIVENEYNELGQLVTKKMGNTTGTNFLQTLEYKYHVRGWLESVNDPANLGSDLFGYQLYYNQIPTSGLSPAKYNGNIIAQDWATNISGTEERHRYSYTYDGFNQLLSADMSRSNGGDSWSNTWASWNTSYTYDLNGNIKSLERDGEPDVDGYPTTMDNLNYTYIGNQIQAISDNGGTPANIGFVDGVTTTTEYEYDLNGNMTSDANKGITSITYNQMNLPEIITFDDGNGGEHKMVYVYDAAGSKLRKTTYPAGGGAGVVTDYANGVVYTDGNLDFAPFAEGRIRYTGSFVLEYDLKDHLGNVRATFKDGNGSVLLQQADSYYPFGYKMPGLSYLNGGADENKFTYNGKELEDEFGLDWYHYGARFYDPIIGRWWAIDPVDEFNSPYTYVASNPIVLIDPDGEQSEGSGCCSFEYVANYVFRKYDNGILGRYSRADGQGQLDNVVRDDLYNVAIDLTHYSAVGLDIAEDGLYVAAIFTKGTTLPFAEVAGNSADALYVAEAGLEYLKASHYIDPSYSTANKKMGEALIGIGIDRTISKGAEATMNYFKTVTRSDRVSREYMPAFLQDLLENTAGEQGASQFVPIIGPVLIPEQN